MAEWARTVATTITNYAKDYEDELIANRILLKAMEKAGNIVRNVGGIQFQWQVPYRLAPMTVDDGETPVTPSRQDRFKNPVLAWAGYRLSDMMTKRERLQNKGPQALINYFEEMAKMLLSDARQRLSEELYIDQSASGNSMRLAGFESMMATNGTVNISTGAQRSANAADVVGYPNDTYAGISTVLGNYSGSWGTQSGIASTWPAGVGELGYDFYSPTIVNYTSTAFAGSGGTHTWATQAKEATRFMIVHMSRYVSDMGGMKIVLLDRELYRQYLELLDSKERINISSELSLRSLGFQETFQQDGVDIAYEYGIPSSVGYGYNIKMMELKSQQEEIFHTDGPWYEKIQRCYPVIVDFQGQLKFHSPRFFGKLMTLA